jgi:hypothetical protein
MLKRAKRFGDFQDMEKMSSLSPFVPRMANSWPPEVKTEKLNSGRLTLVNGSAPFRHGLAVLSALPLALMANYSVALDLASSKSGM